MNKHVMYLVAVALFCASYACSSGGSDKEQCPAGDRNCACLEGEGCTGDLQCVEGFCVTPTTCAEGSEGCACYSNGTCDSKDGVVMECVADVCVVPGASELGKLGDVCDDDSPCGLDGDVQLDCREGTCQVPEVVCEAGSLGCPCDDGACDGSLVCTDGSCQAAAGSGLFVGNGDVRACDILLDLENAEIQYASTVTGVTARDGKRLALSFAFNTDSAALVSVGAVVVLDGDTVDTSTLTFTKVECYDRLGKVVAEPNIEFK